MSRTPLTVFLCTEKDCAKAWRHICADSPRKWLKRRFAEAGIPCRLNVVKANCMDRCDQAACLHFVQRDRARLEVNVRSQRDLARLFETALDILDGPWRTIGAESSSRQT
jgi:hypothetical protein